VTDLISIISDLVLRTSSGQLIERDPPSNKGVVGERLQGILTVIFTCYWAIHLISLRSGNALGKNVSACDLSREGWRT
jgi:hypothetical protein